MSLTLKQLPKFIAKTLLLSSLTLLVLVAIVMGLVRIVTPVLAHQRGLVEQVFSFALAQPVQIGKVTAEWDGFMPAIALQQVTIGTDTAAQPAFKIVECAFDINVFEALLTGYVKVEGVKIVDAQFIVRQFTDNSVSINGLWTYKPSPSEDIWWLPKKLPVALENIELTWYGKNNTAPLSVFLGLADIKLHLATDAKRIKINAINSIINFGPLFRAPIPLNNFTSRIEWQRDDDGDWIVKASDLLAQNRDGIVTADLSLLFPKDNSGLTISLLGAMHVHSSQHIGNYLPLTVLRPTLVKWLEESILSTKDAQGTIVLQGKFADFPFNNGTGTFIIDSQVKDTELRFWSGWPALHDINADLIFTGQRMDIHAYSARIMNTPVQNVTAYIPLLKKGTDATLYIDGNIAGDAADGVGFLREAPIHGDFLDTLKTFEGKGPMQLQLHLALPLDHADDTPPTVAGKLALTNSVFNIPKWHITLNNLQGNLNFTRDSVTTVKDLTASLWDKPLTIAITPDATIRLNYKDIIATITSQSGNWALQLRNPNLQGQVTIPKNKQQPLQANFSYLYLSADATKNSKQQWSPQDLPAINFNCNDVRYGTKKFGQVQLQLRPITNGTNITLLQASSAAFTIKANGKWLNINGNNQTQLRGTLTSPAISDALASWDLPAGITAQQSNIDFNLNWLGTAYDPSFETLNGQLNLHIKQGEFTDVGRGTAVKIGIGRILNLLSIKSLIKDLKLDFDDLKSSGFAFDNLKGNFILRNGNAFTQNTNIKGSVADINMTGRIGLANKDYDLQIAVMPNMTSSLPVIIGLAGGPIAGAITWAADKLLSPAVRSVTSNNYNVTGSWDNPTVVKAGAKITP